MTGKAEHSDILKAMHSAFAGSIKAMAETCSKATADPTDAFASRALNELVSSNVLDAVRLDGLTFPIDLLDAQVRSIYGRQGAGPQRIATDAIIALVDAATGAPLTRRLRGVFHDGLGQEPGWARTFENLFSRDVQQKDELFRILMLDRVNEISTDVKAVRSDLADTKDEILAAIAALGRHSLNGGASPLAAIETLEEALAQDNLSDADRERIAKFYGEFLKRTTEIPDPLVDTMVRDLSAASDPQLLEAALKNMAGADRQTAIRELASELESDVSRIAERYRSLASFAALESSTLALSLYAKAVELDPGDVLAWINLSYHHCIAGNAEGALRTAQQAGQHAGSRSETVRARCTLGDAWRMMGESAKAAAAYEAALELAQEAGALEALGEDDALGFVIAQDRHADLVFFGGELAAARVAREATLQAAERLVALQPDNDKYKLRRVWAQIGLGWSCINSSDQQQAAELFEAAKNIARAAESSSNLLWSSALAQALEGLAAIAADANHPELGLRLYLEQLELLATDTAADPQTPTFAVSVASARIRVVAAFAALGRWDEALQHVHAAAAEIDAVQQSQPDASWWKQAYAEVTHRKAWTLTYSGEHQAALRVFEAAIGAFRELVETEVSALMNQALMSAAMVDYARALMLTDQIDQANLLVNEAIALQSGLVAADPSLAIARIDLRESYNALGMACELRGDWQGEREAYSQAISWARKRSEANPQNSLAAKQWGLMLDTLGRCQIISDLPSDGADDLRKAATIFEELAKRRPDQADHWCNLASVQRGLALAAGWRGDLAELETWLSAADESIAVVQQIAPTNCDVLHGSAVQAEYAGDFKMFTGRFDEAQARFAAGATSLNALQLLEAHAPRAQIGLWTMRKRNADLCAQQFDWQEAQGSYAALAEEARQQVERWPNWSSYWLGMAEIAEGDREVCERYAKRSASPASA